MFSNALFLRFLVAAILVVLVSPVGAAAGAASEPVPARAMLGINIAAGPPGGAAAPGVTVMGVSPGGPADLAGLRAGDVLLSLDAVSLAAPSERAASQRLLAAMRRIRPGDEVAVSYLRDGEPAQTRLVAATFDPALLGQGLALPEPPGWAAEGPGSAWPAGPFAGLALVPVSADLGRYFKTDGGLLVVTAPPAPEIPLRDGDVILAIGSRAPRDPEHAYRILQSYAPGEPVQLSLVREGRRQELSFPYPAPAAPPPPPP